MRRKNASVFVKKITAGVLTVAMVVAGFVIIPKTAEAANDKEQAIYVKCNRTDFIKSYKTDNKKAPVYEGYVFGGWYQDVNDAKKALTVEEAGKEADNETGAENIYAKFVPAYVLSVKTQNKTGTSAATTDPTDMRILTAVDSLDYLETGLELYTLNQNKKDVEPNAKVYKKISVGDQITLEADQVFGSAAKYFSVWRLTGIPQEYFDDIVYVRPYWKTVDGTIVKGLAKYVYVEDGYKKYVNVPVNLMSGNDVAAGVVTITYPSDKLKFVGCENGRVFDDGMECNSSTPGTVKVVGNNAVVGGYCTPGECLYANVRFERKEDTPLYNTDGTRNIWFDFSFTEDFSDWEENRQVAGVWNVQQ